MKHYKIIDLLSCIANSKLVLPNTISTENRFEDSVELCKNYKSVFEESSLSRVIFRLKEEKIKVTLLEQKAVDKLLLITSGAYAGYYAQKALLETSPLTMSLSPANLDSFTSILNRDTLSPLGKEVVISTKDYSSTTSDREIDFIITAYGIDTLLATLKMSIALFTKIYKREKR